MPNTFRLEIVTPEKMAFSDDVHSLVAPAVKGYFGVLAGHAPMLCTFEKGNITIKKDDREYHYKAESGFIEVTPHKTIVLSESVKEATHLM